MPIADLAAADDLVVRLRRAGCVFAEEEAALLRAAASGSQLESLLSRRIGGEPLEYVLGWADFAGLRVAVRPGVFVPRRRTELLVDLVVDNLPGGVPAQLIELCCGSGAIAAAVLHRRPDVKMWVADCDPVAVAVAGHNLAGQTVLCGDLFAPLPETLLGRVDVVVANAPYVPTGSIALLPPEARDHEQRAALDGGLDGLAVIRRIFQGAPRWLRPHGILLVETSRTQAPLLQKEMTAHGWQLQVISDDSNGGHCGAGGARLMGLRLELFVRDVQASAEFYRGVLGFTVLRSDLAGGVVTYASLVRNDVRLGLGAESNLPQTSGDGGFSRDRLAADRGAGVEIVLEVDGAAAAIDAMFDDLSGRDVRIAEPPRDRPWGLRDFRILDPDGYYWRITHR